GTLTQWLKTTDRTWREVLEVFLPAGRGLHAAHMRDLIHRDFKPDNVMVSVDGQVQVMDFGLARASTGSSTGSSTDNAAAELGLERDSALSQPTDGRLAGTPAYMAVEQIEAKPLGPTTDQFAFCVSLWQGVCGQRPFEGELVSELYLNMVEGNVRPPPASARMPRWLKHVLLRGLDPQPAARWPSMEQLLSVLERGRRRWRWQVALAGAAAIAVSAGSVFAWRQQQARAARELVATCEAEGATIDQIWNEGERDRVRLGLLGTKASFASDSLDTLVPWLDEYRDAWRAGRTEVCRHRTIERDWDEQRVDRSMWCFEDRRLQFEATINQIATSNVQAARRAVRVASYLEPVAACLDPQLLQRLPAPPLELRDEIRSIRADLTESDQLRHNGNFADSLEVARKARQRADTLGWPPLRASARLIEGVSARNTGRFSDAEDALTTAYFDAEAAGSIEVAFRAARSLVPTLCQLQRYHEAETWSRHADALSPELSDPSGLDAAEKYYLLQRVYDGLGDYEAAALAGEQALRLRTEALGPAHPITAAAVRNLGLAYLKQERFGEALEMFDRSAAVWEDAVGHDHPYVGGLAEHRGRALLAMGRVDEALASMQQALAIHQQVLRPGHPSLAENLGGLSEVLLALGRIDEAASANQRAMAIEHDEFGPGHRSFAARLRSASAIDLARGRSDIALERAMQARQFLEALLEPHHPELASAMERIADVMEQIGRYDDAVRHRREALTRRESARGLSARELITPLVRLGHTLRNGGELDDARQSYTRALKIAEPQSPACVPSLTGLAEILLIEGDAVAARRHAEQAVRIVEQRQPGPRMAADAHFALARALRISGEAEARVSSLAQRARDEFAAAHRDARRAEIEGWLASLDSQPGAVVDESG
ncbi:MAG: tetratricopeptide repeat protein, partial [Deltaproteobacteria bacterium]|nr:tetratricopeptide repeat protein [Deltaproteobacteria bacterium]